MRKRTRTVTLLVLWCSMAALTSPAAGSSLHLTRVADDNTVLPGGSGISTGGLFYPPALSGSRVAFEAYTNDGPAIYLFDGGVLSRVAGPTTPIPNGTCTFTGFNVEVLLLSEDNLVFHGFGESDQQGIYIFDGSTIRRVMDLSTPIPNGTGTFTGFGPPSLDGGKVAFVGNGESGQAGVYLFDGSALTRVASTSTLIPDGSGTFTRFNAANQGAPAISGSRVAFEGEGNFEQRGIYLFDRGTLSRVADKSTFAPDGTGTLDFFDHPVLSDTMLAFTTFGAQQGIYRFDGAALSRVVGLDTPIPHGTGSFRTEFPLLSGSNVAFQGLGDHGQFGFYLLHDSTLDRVADLKTSIPNGVGTFELLFSPALSGDSVAFIGVRLPSQSGIYLFKSGTLSHLADTATPTPNRPGHFIGFDSLALSGDNFAFLGRSEGGGIGFPGIYLGSPAPGLTARVGLRNGDDVGTAFDLQVEVYKNGSSFVASGVERCIRGLSRNSATAPEIGVVFDPLGAVPVGSGEVLSLKVSARIGTNSDDSRCTGNGATHGSATGLRLYYDSAGQASRFDATIDGSDAQVYLHSDGGVCTSTPSAGVTTRFMDTTAPTAAQARCKDSGAVKFAGGNPWSEIGTWIMTAP